MSGEMILNKKTQYARRCDLCHRPVHSVYEVRFENGGPLFTLCSPLHVKMAQERFERNKKEIEDGEV